MTIVSSLEALEAVVGTRPLASMMKSIPALDEHCVRLLAHSPFAVIGFADAGGRARATTAGGAPGFVTVEDATHLRVELHARVELAPDVGCGLLFFVPGLGETLRVNGRGVADGATLVVTVEEAFAHCAKALLRSSLWTAPPVVTPPSLDATATGPQTESGIREWLARAPLVVLTSWDARGRADASPKGDPPGFVRVEGGRLLIPDRPGNRRTDTFHNVVEQPRVALLALVPGDDRALEVSGAASLTSEPALLAGSAVMGKTPKIALLLDPEEARVTTSRALAEAKLWDASRHVPASALPNMAHVFIDHVKLNRERGAAATAVRALASKRVMRWALAHDYETNRY
ncbi:MAG: pyridoxamine 5'-phosphate oxidase family protein [Labilithrix sp.]|nr:pyridoxamine 5'-phosphate oxidase family protein [Labilithrix sp.]